MYEFPCAGPIAIRLSISGGEAEIVAEERDTATVDVQPWDGSDGSREAAERARVEFRDGHLVIEAPDVGGWLIRRSPRLQVRARVPLGCTLQVKTASADVTAHGRYATAEINSASGNVYLEHVTGDLSANAASGEVRATQVDGNLRVNTASGDVAVQVVGGEVAAKSASGDLEFERVGAGVRAGTASGDIRIGSASRGDIRINTASGDVSVGVVSGTGVWLDLHTLSGDTRSDLAVSDTTSGRRDLSIYVKTMSGDIAVRRVSQPAPATPAQAA